MEKFNNSIELLIAAGIDINMKNNYGFTSLHQAAGANPLIVNSQGKTALDYASSCYDFCREKSDEDLLSFKMAIACLNLLKLAVIF